MPPALNQSEELFLSERRIIALNQEGKPHFDEVSMQDIPLDRVVNLYKIDATNVFMDKSQVHHLTQNTFNFQATNEDLQGQLRYLAKLLKAHGNEIEAQPLIALAGDLEEVENAKNPKEVKKSGVVNWMKDLVTDLGDKNSPIYKAITGMEKGAEIAQKIGKSYNKVAQWVGFPVIPGLFLGNKE